MVLLRWNELGVELDLTTDGLLQAGELSVLMSLDDAVRDILARARERVEADAREAARHAAALDAQARSRQAQAGLDAERARRLGFAAGRREALDAWSERAVDAGVDRRLQLGHWQDWLARVVVEAVARIVDPLPACDVYAAALARIAAAFETAGPIVLRVHGDDVAAARAALDSLDARGLDVRSIRLESDDALPRRSCIALGETGRIDAGLDMQLQSLGRAVRRLVERREDAA